MSILRKALTCLTVSGAATVAFSQDEVPPPFPYFECEVASEHLDHGIPQKVTLRETIENGPLNINLGDYQVEFMVYEYTLSLRLTRVRDGKSLIANGFTVQEQIPFHIGSYSHNFQIFPGTFPGLEKGAFVMCDALDSVKTLF